MLYNGIFELKAHNNEEIASFYQGEMELDLKINQYLILKNEKDEVIDKLRWDGNSFVPLTYPKVKGFKPKTIKQEFLADLLSNKDIPIKIIAGCAGSGKTAVSIMFGMHFLLKGLFQKIFVVRHNVSVGEKMGFLPGTKFEKIRGWLGFMEDNLMDSQMTIEELYEKGSLDTDSLEMMKGRSIANSFIMIEESEDIDESQFKMLGERISYDSVICFIGDYNQVTHEKYRVSSGLKRAIENLSGNPLCGVLVFDEPEFDNVRSNASKLFTTGY